MCKWKCFKWFALFGSRPEEIFFIASITTKETESDIKKMLYEDTIYEFIRY